MDRVVDQDIRPFALGFQWMLIRLLGKSTFRSKTVYFQSSLQVSGCSYQMTIWQHNVLMTYVLSGLFAAEKLLGELLLVGFVLVGLQLAVFVLVEQLLVGLLLDGLLLVGLLLD